MVAGAAPKTGAVVTLEDGVAQVLALKEQGMRLKDAAKEVAEHTGLSKTSCTPPPWSGKGEKISRHGQTAPGLLYFVKCWWSKCGLSRSSDSPWHLEQ